MSKPQRNPQFEAHVSRRRDQPPRVLYKYRSIQAAVQIIEAGTLFWASPDLFADTEDCKWNPFEPLLDDAFKELHYAEVGRMLTGSIDWADFKNSTLRRLVGNERLRLSRLSDAMRQQEVRRTADQLMERFSATETLARARQQSVVRRLRVLCLCETPDSERMWREYADDQRGCVLGFDARLLESFWRVPVERVRYVSAFPELVDPKRWNKSILYGGSGLTHSEIMAVARGWTLTKLERWSYEREWRFVSLQERGAEDQPCHGPFPMEALVEVRVGRKCGRDDETRLRELASRFTRVGRESDTECQSCRPLLASGEV